jgi:hypothetical protein
MGRKISASLFGADFADSPLKRELDGEDRDAKRFGEREFAVAMGWRNASGYFSSASSDFKALGALFCNSTKTLSFFNRLDVLP